MASTYVEKLYSDNAVEMLFKIVQQGKDYDIEIDKTPIINRTNDPELFHDFMDYLEPSTQIVAFRIYRGTSRNYDRTVLLRKSNGLNGIPSEAAREAYDTKPKFDIEKEKSDWEKDRKIEDLTEEVNYLTKQVEVIRKKAKKKIEEAKNSNLSLSGMLETFAPAAVQILANSKLSQTYPALGMLGSITNQEPQEPQETTYNPPPVSEVKFSAQTSESSLTEEQKKQLKFFEQLKNNFEEFELITIFDFLKRAAHDKDLLQNLIPNETENEF